jgi:protein-tyrosine kinase
MRMDMTFATGLELLSDAVDVEPIRSAPAIFVPNQGVSPYVVVAHDPTSLAAEQFRLLAHSIERRREARNGWTIAISSSLPDEGKTVTSLNLAFALAENRRNKVCLCDVDFRDGRVAQGIGADSSEGIIEVLRHKRNALDVLKMVKRNLAVFPSGHPTSHPLVILRSTAWRKFVKTLRSEFDYVLFDCPPLCMSEDMLVIDDMVGNILFVVRAGATTSEAVHDALAKLNLSKVLGFVLNDVPIVEKNYGFYKQEF